MPYIIILAENDTSVRRGIANALKRDGHQVIDAANGKLALKAFEFHRDDARQKPLLLTGVKMPEMDGMELTRTIRGKYPDAPIIILSGAATREEALNAGANKFIEKPAPLQVLRDAINELAGDKKHGMTKVASPTPGGRGNSN